MAGADRYRIVPFTNPSGKVVHRVLGRTAEGKQVRENFRDYGEAVARKHILELEAMRVQQSVRLKQTRLSDEELAQAEDALKRLKGTAHTLNFAVTWFMAHWRPPSSAPTVSAAYKQFMADKATQNLRSRTIQVYRSRVGALVKACGLKRIDEIGTDEIRKLVYREGVSAVCRNGDRRALHAFFEWSVLNGHCSSNPVRRLAPRRATRRPRLS